MMVESVQRQFDLNSARSALERQDQILRMSKAEEAETMALLRHLDLELKRGTEIVAQALHHYEKLRDDLRGRIDEARLLKAKLDRDTRVADAADHAIQQLHAEIQRLQTALRDQRSLSSSTQAGPARVLPTFGGYTVDARLREFRRLEYGKPQIYIPFDSPEGKRLLAARRLGGA